MIITQKPDALSLSGNLKNIILDEATGQVAFTLSVGGSEILSGIYTPDESGRIIIDIRRYVEEQLSFNLTYGTEPWQQTMLARTFSFTAGALAAQTFTAIRTGIDNPGETAANWLRANFLTWQPTVKHVTYSTPEFLTYYAASACRLMVKVYYPDGTSSTLDPIALSAGAWTIPVFYAAIAARLGLSTQEELEAEEQLPGAYDVWIADNSGNVLTYIQRYIAGEMRESEQWILFENSLGGLDCFRAYGQGTLEAEHEHQLAELDNMTEEYRTDTTRKQRRSSGWLNRQERRWLLDFFPSRRRWICENGSFRPIVLTEDSVSYSIDNMPAEFEFSFRYATTHSYLNIPRLSEPQTVLNIKAPDLRSFSVPPRLVEFPRLTLLEGALIPVQSPYSDVWSAVSLDDIIQSVTPAAITWDTLPGKPSWIGADKPSYTYGDGYLTGFASASSVQSLLSLINDLFTKESDGAGGYRIKANYGLYTDSFLSAGGVGHGGQGGGGGINTIYLGTVPYPVAHEGDTFITLPPYPTQVTWNNIEGKPGWIGPTKPSYSFSEISGTASASQIPSLDASKITSGTFAVARIPNLSWNKITSDKPTTVAGYGITDAITTANIGSQSVAYALSAGSVAWANVSGKPTKLSDLTDDVVSGHYLPLSGGTMTGEIRLTTNVGGNIPYAGAVDNASDLTTHLASTKSFIGSILSNSTWYNVLSIRHRNGHSDGNIYGMYIKSPLTGNGNLIWRQQTGSTTWLDERTIYDSGNLTKATLGLGNVDNTADANKSVAYATSAGNADTLDGRHASYFATASSLGNYLPLSGGNITGSIVFNSISTVSPLVRNYTGNISSGWSRKILSLQVDGIEKFAIGGYGNYTAGAEDNGITYAYIGCNVYNGLNLRITATSLKWGTNNIYHSGNCNNTSTPWSCSNLTASASLRIGNIELKDDNGLLHIVGGMYADGQVSAGGLGSGGGGGGGVASIYLDGVRQPETDGRVDLNLSSYALKSWVTSQGYAAQTYKGVIIPLEENGTTTAGDWKAKSTLVTSLEDGRLYLYRIAVAGASTTYLTINYLTRKTIYRYGTTKLTTQYAVGNWLLLTYNATKDAFYVVNDYDANSYVRQYVTTNTDTNTYPLLFMYDTSRASSGSYVTKYSRYADAIFAQVSDGSLHANKFVVANGTSSQFLKADGSVDSAGYTTNTGTVTSVSVIINGSVKGTVTSSGTIDLGTGWTKILSLSGVPTSGTPGEAGMLYMGGTSSQPALYLCIGKGQYTWIWAEMKVDRIIQ